MAEQLLDGPQIVAILKQVSREAVAQRGPPPPCFVMPAALMARFTSRFMLSAELEIGQLTENVMVVAGADSVNSTNAELSDTVSPRQVLELPLNGRNTPLPC